MRSGDGHILPATDLPTYLATILRLVGEYSEKDYVGAFNLKMEIELKARRLDRSSPCYDPNYSFEEFQSDITRKVERATGEKVELYQPQTT